MIDKQHAQMLAALACAARPRGATKWDPAGVMAALAHVRHLPLPEVAIATFRAAADATFHTPGGIGNTTTSCWRSPGIEATGASRTPYDPMTTCGICGKARADCERNPHGEHAFESQADAVRNRTGRAAPLAEDPMLAYLDHDLDHDRETP